MKVSEIKKNPNNPRIIKDAKFEKLKQSIESFPKMMKLRPIILDNDNTILGGNMRFEALKSLGYKEIPDDWVKLASELTEDEKKEFIIKDNVGFGEWDFDQLTNEWEGDKLDEWGVDLPEFEEEIESPFVNENEDFINNFDKENVDKTGTSNYLYIDFYGFDDLWAEINIIFKNNIEKNRLSPEILIKKLR